MANRKVKQQGKGSEVNGEGNEKDDNTSTTTVDLPTYPLTDDNPKIAGLANGWRQRKQ